MPPNILIVIGIAAIFALFLSDNKTENEVKKDDARMVSHGRNRVSSGINSGLGKRRAKRNGTGVKVSHFIEDDDDGPLESHLDDDDEPVKEKEEKQENAE